MTRILAHISCALVILVGVAAWTASLWLVSYRRIGDPTSSDFTVALQRGELWITTVGTYYGPGFRRIHDKPELDRLVWRSAKPLFERHQYTGRTPFSITMPLWYIPAAGVMGVVATSLAGTLTHRSRRRAGRCVTCGYDLAGSRDQCPECGHVVPNKNDEPTAASMT